MIIVRSPREMQGTSTEWRRAGHAIGLVPTMGALHEGHLSLIRLARSQCERLVVSIFVNPTQFGPGEDLDDYPRDFERDRELCEAEGVDAIYAPEVAAMYPPNASTWVVEERLSHFLCGVSRPTHFRGVTTVVAKLFNAVLPDRAVFGRKDAQQARIIQRMVRDLDFPVSIVVAPIVRESDGLAMSSRNAYLSPDERRRALSIQNGLRQAGEAFRAGNRDTCALRAIVVDRIAEAGGKLDYAEIVSYDSLEPVDTVSAPALLAVAARFGETRLIDNALLDPTGAPPVTL